MSAIRISEVARRSGVPATTLRYYEEIGLLTPAGRSDNGYREYLERDIDRLGFISRAKELDLSLDDIAEILVAWDNDACVNVHEQVLNVLASRLAQTRARIANLRTLSRELESAAGHLAQASVRDEDCSPTCACALDTTAPVEPIACSLDPDAAPGRLADWRALAERAIRQTPMDGAMELRFGFDAELVGEIARLAADEFERCSFLRFDLAIDTGGIRLTVTAPPEAGAVFDEIFGSNSDAHTRAANKQEL